VINTAAPLTFNLDGGADDDILKVQGTTTLSLTDSNGVTAGADFNLTNIEKIDLSAGDVTLSFGTGIVDDFTGSSADTIYIDGGVNGSDSINFNGAYYLNDNNGTHNIYTDLSNPGYSIHVNQDLTNVSGVGSAPNA